MNAKCNPLSCLLPLVCLALSALACGFGSTPTPGAATAPPFTQAPERQPSQTPAATSAPDSIPTPTPTPTQLPGGANTPAAPESRCAGLSGEIEVRVLVGPSDAVGLEPHAVGGVPFSVTSSQAPYLVQGSGSIAYGDVLVEEWGTYEVTMNMQLAVQGECLGAAGDEELQLVLEMSGDQLVKVDSQGFHGEYPWAGTHTFDLNFPLVEGASVEGEGYSFILHLNSQ